jgi:uncharacterized protein YqgV (UPF0045/DUF77 family)
LAQLIDLLKSEKRKMPPNPTNEAEFEKAITAIDNELRSSGISIEMRSLHAIAEYATKFDMDIPVPGEAELGAPGDYEGKNVGAHIWNWYSAHYGARQYQYMGPGSVVILLREDPWEIRLPLILGEVTYVVERDLSRYVNSPQVTTNGIHPIVNILTSVCELPAGLANTLSNDECAAIVDRFEMGLDCLRAINEMIHMPYVTESLSDIATAVRHIVSVPSHFGQSKWASAQAAEKLIKSFLKCKEIPFPFSHDIEKLHLLAVPAGLGAIGIATIDALQTKAGVRYGEVPVTLIEAIEAHLASLKVGKLVATARAPRDKMVVELVKGINLAADKNGKIVVAKFDLGNQTKAFWIPAGIVKFILSRAKMSDSDYSGITIPPIEPADWDGTITPMFTGIEVKEFTDVIAIFAVLDRGVTNGLAFDNKMWSLFIKTLNQYNHMLVG